MSDFDNLVKEYWELNARAGDRTIVGRFNKVKELLGEAGARSSAMSAFKVTDAHLVNVPVRNNKVPILDLLYELEDGQFVLLEAKYDMSQLGRTNDKRVFKVGVEGGKVQRTPLVLKEQVEQLSPQWIKQRIDEIATHDPALAAKLRTAAEDGKVNILEVRSRLEADGRLTSVTTNRTQEFREFSGRRLTDPERRYARREALSRLYGDDLKKKLDAANDSAKKAKKAADDAEKSAAKVEKDIRELQKNPGKQKPTIEKRKLELERLQKELPQKQAEAQRLRKEHTNADNVVKEAEEKYKFNLEQMDNDSRARRAEATHKRFETRDKMIADRTAGATEAKAAEAAKAAAAEEKLTKAAVDAQKVAAGGAKVDRAAATAGKNVGGRMVERESATGARLGAKAVVEDVGKGVVKVVEATPKKAVYEILRGVKVVARVGVKVFSVIELANPIFDMLMLIDIVDALVAWLDRDRINDRKEWARLFGYFFGPEKTVTSIYGIPYVTSIYPYIDAWLQVELGNDKGRKNFVYFLNKWESDKRFSGFVYAQIDVAGINRQERPDHDEEFSVKYYYTGIPQITLVETAMPNYRKQGPGLNLGAQDERNLSTHGKPAPYASPEYTVDVEMSNLDVRITHPAPTLTPFDFIIAKCRGLIAEIVEYIAALDDRVYSGMSVTEEVFGLGDIAHRKQYWLEGMDFKAPLVSLNVHLALKNTIAVVEYLSQHSAQSGDEAITNPPWTRGYIRRLLMLQKLATGMKEFGGRRIMLSVSAYVLNLVKEEDKTLEMLSTYAGTIDDDIVRTFKACRETNAREFTYQGGMPRK